MFRENEKKLIKIPHICKIKTYTKLHVSNSSFNPLGARESNMYIQNTSLLHKRENLSLVVSVPFGMVSITKTSRHFMSLLWKQ